MNTIRKARSGGVYGSYLDSLEGKSDSDGGNSTPRAGGTNTPTNFGALNATIASNGNGVHYSGSLHRSTSGGGGGSSSSAAAAAAAAPSRPVSAPSWSAAPRAMISTLGSTPFRDALAAHKPLTIESLTTMTKSNAAAKPKSGLRAIQSKIASSPFHPAPAPSDASSAALSAAEASGTGAWFTKAVKRSLSNGEVQMSRPQSVFAPTKEDADFLAPEGEVAMEDGDGDDAIVEKTKAKKTKTKATAAIVSDGEGTTFKRLKKSSSEYVDSEAGHDRASDRSEFGRTLDESVYRDENERDLTLAALEEHKERGDIKKQIAAAEVELVKFISMKAETEKTALDDPSKQQECDEFLAALTLAIESKTTEIYDLQQKHSKLQPIVADKVVTVKSTDGMPVTASLWFSNLETYFNTIKLKFEVKCKAEQRYREAMKALVHKHVSDMLETVADQVELKVSKKENKSGATKRRSGRVFTYAYTKEGEDPLYVMATLCAPDRFSISSCGRNNGATAQERRPRVAYTGTFQIDYYNKLLETNELKSIFPADLDMCFYPACMYFTDKLSLTQKF